MTNWEHVAGIAGLTVISVVVLLTHQDGYIATGAIAAIAGIAGYNVGKASTTQ